MCVVIICGDTAPYFIKSIICDVYKLYVGDVCMSISIIKSIYTLGIIYVNGSAFCLSRDSAYVCFQIS
jgi:hypothetical protein